MDLQQSQKFVKVMGIIDIVVSVLVLIVAVLSLGLGGVGVSAVEEDPEVAESGAMLLVAGILLLIVGIVNLLQGIFALKAAKDATKYKPLWIFAILGLIGGVLTLITSFSKGGSAIFSALISLVMSALFFWAANNIKKSVS